MRVLVACVESQTVCKAFREKGHEAFSCDIVPCSGGHPEWHIREDVLYVIRHPEIYGYFDLMIAHPPCTYLANSGVCHLYNKDKSVNHERWVKVVEARNFFYAIRNAPIKRICIENPVPHKYANLPKYDQIIQPYEFGHPETKKTCLWLQNLPDLKATNNVKEEMLKLPKNQQQRLHYLPPSDNRAKLRSKTFEGIAKAMADQWG